MAYRWEKEDEEDVLVIDGWEGIASDPYSGMNYMLGVSLETPGEVAVGYPITASTISGATIGKPIARSTRFFPTYGTPVGIPSGSAVSYAILDDGGQVFEATSITGTFTFLSSSNSTTGSSNKDGIAHWLGYLWKFRNNAIDYWNGTTWVTGWDPTTGGTGGTPLDSGVKHFGYVASNNQLYITNGNTIARIFAPTPASFDPTNTATYDFNAEILALPVTDSSLSLAEVGGGSSPQSTLLIGGSQNAIYPWDKISTSFGLPIYVADGYIGKMISVNQNAFIFPGNTGGRGRIYITNGSQADLFYKVPDYIFGYQEPYFEWGDAIYHRNELIFGMFPTTNSSVHIQNFTYVWALNLATKKFRAISPITAGSQFDNYANVLIAAVNPSTAGFSYILGWSGTGGTYGIGYSGTAAGTGSASILTDKIPIGTFLQKQTFTQVEFKLRSPLKSGESITMTPYVDDTLSTSLSFQPTVTTGSISGVANVTFQGNQWLQFIVNLTGANAESGVRLKEIRIR